MLRARKNQTPRILFILLGLASLVVVPRAQTSHADVVTTAFSGDLVITHAGSPPKEQRGRIYVSGAKVRIETPEFVDGFFIVDGDRSSAWFVRPGRFVFMDAKQSSPLTQVFVPVDPQDACGRWQIMADIAGAEDGGSASRCERLGDDIVDGRAAVKYLATSNRNQRSYRWIDPQRGFPVKLESEDGTTVAIENIVEAPQRWSRFTIPLHYSKFDPVRLINQIKGSDVWIEPPQ
jgi:hypothetical protein